MFGPIMEDPAQADTRRCAMSASADDRSRPWTTISCAAEALFPGYFALVMATGVVSIASFLLGYTRFAHILVWLNWLFYLVLWALTLVRIIVFPRRIIDDLSNHQRAPGFFTTVAGTCVLGTQSVIVAGLRASALRCGGWAWGSGSSSCTPS